MKKKKNISELSLEKIYDRFAIFFFSSVLLILAAILTVYNKEGRYFQNGATIFFSLGFLGYSFLMGEFTGNYLARTFIFLREKYQKYYRAYWVSFMIFAVAVLIIIGKIFLGDKKIIEIMVSTALVGLLGIISYFLKEWYEKRNE